MAATTVAWTAGTFAAAFCGDRGQGKKNVLGQNLDRKGMQKDHKQSISNFDSETFKDLFIAGRRLSLGQVDLQMSLQRHPENFINIDQNMLLVGGIMDFYGTIHLTPYKPISSPCDDHTKHLRYRNNDEL